MQPINGKERITFRPKLIAIESILLPLLILALAKAQCPWTRESVELHSDCICDFNPSPTTNLEHLPPINRMSVQCAPVNFSTLLQALKQTASIELPQELLWLQDNANANHSSHGGDQTISWSDEQRREAATHFVSQSKIDLLHLSNSSIGRLEQNTFVLDLAELQRFDGSNVQLGHQQQQQPTEGARRLAGPRLLVVAMQSLHLSRCHIEEIHARAFTGLEWSLTSLSLSDNQIEHVPSLALRSLVNLKVLDLSNNKLVQVESNAFFSLNKLNTLRLADNRLNSYQRQTAASSQLRTSSVQNVSDQIGIDRRAFVGLEDCLSDLSLKNTQLAELPEAAKHLRKLAFLNLAQNHISFIAPRSFERTNSLTAINLERNRIANIHADTFAGVERSLSSLSLLGNLLAEFPVRELAKLSALRRLDIGFNEIEHIPADAFVAHPRLMLIALDGNPIESLPEIAFKPLEGILTGMSVGGKSLNCDCRLSWMLHWQREHNLQISSREREPQFCAKPNYLRSLVSFAALNPEHLTCDLPTTTTPFAFSVASMDVNGQLKRQPTLSNSSNNPERQSGNPNESGPTTHTTLAITTLAPQQVTSAATEATTTTTATSSPDLVEAGTSDESTVGSEFADAETTTSLAKIFEQIQSGSGSSRSRVSSLPDDDLFLLEPQPNRKTNRQGYQADKQQDLMRQRVTSSPKVGSDTQTTTARHRGHVSSPAVFGARSNPTSEKQQQQQQQQEKKENRPATSQVNLASANVSALVPAIPTTLNVYKNLLGSSGQANQSRQQSVLWKGPRLVDEQTHSTGFKLANFEGADLDIERYSAQPSQVEPTKEKATRPTTTLPPASTSMSTSTTITWPSQASSHTTSKEQQRASSVYLDGEQLSDGDLGDLIARERPAAATTKPTSQPTTQPTTQTQAPPTSTSTRAPANNTRMSVSSMYRLSTTPRLQWGPSARVDMNATKQPQTTTPRARADLLAQDKDRTSWPLIAAGSRVTTTTSTPAPSALLLPAAGTSRAPAELRTSESRLVSTTRMAATVRFVDSSPTHPKQHATSPPTSSSNSTQPKHLDNPLLNQQASPHWLSTQQLVAFSKKPEQQQVVFDQPVATRPIEIRQNASKTTTSEAPTSERPTGSDELQSASRGLNTSSAAGEERQQEDDLSAPSEVAITTTRPAKSSQSRQPIGSLVTKDSFSFVSRQARGEEQTFHQIDGSTRLFSKLFRSVDVDQVALVLAGLLCLIILLLALTTICLCCCGRVSSGQSQVDSSLATLSRTNGAKKHATKSPTFLARLFCCSSGHKQVTPLRSLILQEDDNSSGGRSSTSTGLKSSGKSTFFAGKHFRADDEANLFRSIRRASMRLAAVHSQQAPARLINTMGSRKKAATGGKRSQLEAESSHLAGDRWRVCVLPDDAISSCDSDKSCSPGANRNNRYDISEAHKAYLSSRGGQQIRASRFVTTSEESGGQNVVQHQRQGGHSRAGLLKTIESRQQQHSTLPVTDYFDAYSGMSSDKSTTDDSGAPLSSNRPSASGFNKTFGLKSQSRRSQAAELEAANEILEAHRQQQQDELLASTDLVPMSAEEQWPEPPYVAPEEQEQEEGDREEQFAQQFTEQTAGCSFGQPANSERHLFVQFEPMANLNQRSQANTSTASAKRQHFSQQQQQQQQQHHRHHQQQPQANRQPPIAYDDAHLYNWHTASRNLGRPQVHHVARTPNENHPQAQSALVRYRSNPSLQQSFAPLSQQAVGASSWLRWTPTTFAGQPNNQSQTRAQAEEVPVSWHEDNQVESVLVANKQHR